MSNQIYCKKLIEVALPLDAINDASRKEKNPFLKGHPRSMHLWWARRPLAACRAVLFAQLVDDPSSHPDKFPTEEAQKKERERLFKIIEDLVKWENRNNERVLQAAREEILKSTEGSPPPVLDPFCGGGSIPLEAQRLGLKAYASDLNPVAVLITKALIEIPPKFADKPPVHPGGQTSTHWHGAKGLAEDVRYYGKWMRDEAEKRIGHLYPKVTLPSPSGRGVGGEGKATVIAWLWARTVKCPNPACGAQMPLVRSFALSTKRGRQAWVKPVVKGNEYHFEVQTGEGKPREGTVNRRGATCLCCGTPVPFDHVRSEGKAGRMGERLMAIVAEGNRGRVYVGPEEVHVQIAKKATPEWFPDAVLPHNPRDFKTPNYGMNTFADLFTPRQLVTLTTFSDLVMEARDRVLEDAVKAGMPNDLPAAAQEGSKGINDGGSGALAYAEAVTTYLAFGIAHMLRYSCVLTLWNSTNQNLVQAFGRQAMPMVWDYAESNPIVGILAFSSTVEWVASALSSLPPGISGSAFQLDTTQHIQPSPVVIVTDPPYYDNIGYADLSDFFYIWLRRSLGKIFPSLFSTLLTPKAEELVATPYRFDGDKERARRFFENGLRKAFIQMRKVTQQDYPITLFYAFKQTETEKMVDGSRNDIIASTGWETMLEGLLQSELTITGTWPVRTEKIDALKRRMSALASSIILVCRRRSEDSPITTRRDFLSELKRDLPSALRTLQQGNIAPVDLAQAAIGPGMAIFSRYSKVLEADGTPMRVRSALSLINEVLDEYLSEQEGEYDADTRWALAWFEQHGMEEGPYGVAETLSKAKNTAVDGLVAAGIIVSKAGKVRILRRAELPDDWDPATDKRLTVWEVTQYLIRAIVDKGSEEAAAVLLKKVGALRDVARDLAYRLYTICDRKKWAHEALAYNSLVVAWPELAKLAGQKEMSGPSQQELFQE